MRVRALVIPVLLMPGFLFAVPAAPGEALEKKVKEIAAGAGGTVGVKAVHLESGKGVGVNASDSFPMQSVFKLPLAIAVLKTAEEGKVALSEEIPVEKDDLRPVGSVEETWKPGAKFPIDDLLRRMIIESDNTSADLLLRRLGGPKAVEAKLVAMGLSGIDISLTELRLMATPRGATVPANEKCSPECLEKLTAAVPDADRKKAMAAFRSDPRNTATPDALVAMLVRLSKGELLGKESTRKLLDWMTQSPTGRNRIRGLLPKDVSTASKTGTGHGCVNDAGIVTLPGGAGHIAIVVLVKHSERPTGKVEKVIAEISREVVASLR